MHMLSQHNRSEFLATPQLIRFDYAQGHDGFEPTLLIKGSTLLLKYIVLGAPMQLAFTICNERLLYALRIRDDGTDGGILWSVVERAEEQNGIRNFAQGDPLTAFLFNEIAVNVSWNEWPTEKVSSRLSAMVDQVQVGPVDHVAIKTAAFPLLKDLHSAPKNKGEWLIMDIGERMDWKPVQNRFITAHTSSSLIDLFNSDEGDQQEQIGIWLTDNLQPLGTFHSPQKPYKEAQKRELTDILLSYQFGAILIESKTLSMLTRDTLPDRTTLKRNISKHIKKAFTQLRGGIKTLKSGVEVTNVKGEVLSIDRENPAHAIVLIPDLDLIDDPNQYGETFITDFMNQTGGFPHLLDISELLRMVQAAEIIAAQRTETTVMMAFDCYLMERLKVALKSGTLRVEVLLRFAAQDSS